MKRSLLFFIVVICASVSNAQIAYDTLFYRNLAAYSEGTVADLAADTEHWTYNSKGRYQNAVATDGQLLKANGHVIAECDGVWIGAGIEAGSLLLRHAMGKDNGLQMQRNKPITLKSLRQGQEVRVVIKSSSKTAAGIASVTNLRGDCGEGTYPGTTFATYTFEVAQDGDVSFTNSGGVVIQSIGVFQAYKDTSEHVATPVITAQDGLITLTCETEGAELFYSLIDHGTVEDYAVAYSGPFVIDRTCRVRAIACKAGLTTSLPADSVISIPLVMPFEGRPYVLLPEKLGRGAIAVNTGSTGQYLLSWRLLIDDPADVSFNVYRDGTKLNGSPITGATCLSDRSGSASAVYEVESLHGGEAFERTRAWVTSKSYFDIPVSRPADTTIVQGTGELSTCTYYPGDCMVADLDGDQEYEIVMKWDPGNPQGSNDDANTAGQKDNSISGYTGNVFIDAYRMDGTRLWRISLGRNIRAGAHYTQLMVYDLDGDGKAEVACKTAPGTIDGRGRYVLLGDDDPAADYRGSAGGKSGMVLGGNEYLTVFNGETGAEEATAMYQPSFNVTGWGDNYGNRGHRYLACVACLDGERHSLVMCRGYYTAAFLWAVDFDRDAEGKGQLTTRWLHQSMREGYGAYGEGAHGISVADVDGDGCDEIIYGSCAVDHDGTLMYRTGLGHGDALHVGDLDPDRKGLEVMMAHEETSAKYGMEMHEALTGKHISGMYAGSDVGRGVCADIDASHRGCEYWGYSNYVCDVNGNVISTQKPSANFRTFWDADLQEEITEKGEVTKWAASGISTLMSMTAKGAGTNLIKATPCLQADIFGDWREEQIYYDAATRSHLWIFSTPIATSYRVPTLMHDHHYRMATVWQTSAYNQPPHLSYFLPDYVKWVTGTEPLVAQEATVVSVRYYNLQGQAVAAPGEGLYLVERFYSDGTRQCEKAIFSVQ